MMVLYHCMSARSFRPLWMLEELGLDYDLQMLPFPPRQSAKAYLDINPLGTVPAFIDHGALMTESSAICQYLAERHRAAGMHVGVDEPDYGRYLNFLHFGEATLTFPQTLVLRYGRFETPERLQPQVAEDYAKWFLSRLRTLEPVLAQQEYLCAGRFTAADVSVGYALFLAEFIDLAVRFTPAVKAYSARLQARPGFQRAIEAQRQAAIAQGVSLAAAADAPA